MNKVEFKGNLGKNAKLFYTKKGKAGIHLSVAINEEEREATWVTVFAHSSTAKKAFNLNLVLGDFVHIKGELRSNGKGELHVVPYFIERLALKSIDNDDIPF